MLIRKKMKGIMQRNHKRMNLRIKKKRSTSECHRLTEKIVQLRNRKKRIRSLLSRSRSLLLRTN